MESEATVVSDPPGFGGPTVVGSEPFEHELPDDPALDTVDREGESTLDRLLDDQPTGVTLAVPPRVRISTEERAEEEPTRLDVGLETPTPMPMRDDERPRRPTPAPLVRPSLLAAADADRPLDEDDVLDAPTQRRRSRDSISPVQEARSPVPAVSALAPRRTSRRTPISGVPIDDARSDATPGRGLPSVQTPPGAAVAMTGPSGSPPPATDGPLPGGAPGVTPGFPLAAPVTPLPMLAHAGPIDTPAGQAPWAPQPEAPPPWPVAAPFAPSDPSLSDISIGVGKLSPSRRALVWWTLGALVSFAIIAAVVAMVRSGPPPAPTSVAIEVISIPAGATVKVDGSPISGTTPLTWADARPGKTYRLVVELPKHEPWLRDEPIPDNTRRVKVIASLKPILGKLTVTSEPTGAEVFLNNRSVGRTPLTLTSVDPFLESKVEVRLRGHKPAVQPVAWPPQYETSLAFRLTPARD